MYVVMATISRVGGDPASLKIILQKRNGVPFGVLRMKVTDWQVFSAALKCEPTNLMLEEVWR